ncbi:MAG: hypothetical protein Q7U47_12370 [Paludibacter sp.]|nr:hypothetical protein [Paludibacter sp.]
MESKNNINKDVFGEMMRNRLENTQVQVDENCWAEIEQRMTKKRKVIPFWFWTTLGGVAAIALIMLTLRPFSDVSPLMEQTFEQSLSVNNISTGEQKTETTTTQNKSEKQENSGSHFSKQNTKASNQKTATKSHKILSSTNQKSLTAEYVQPEVSGFEEASNTNKNETPHVVEKVNGATDKSEPLKEQGEVVKTKKYTTLTDNLNEPEKVYSPNKQRSKRTLIAAALGTGSNASLQSFSSKDLASGLSTSQIVETETKYSNIMSPSDFSTITHLPPISFGLKASKELSDNWSIESGLVYTYLASIYKNGLYQKIDANLNLHYLGIPVNIINTISSRKNWDIYVSGGAMVEKGLRSIYNQYSYVGDYTYTTVAKTKIDGFQWSANVAFGANYRLSKDLGIYIEPVINYYFNNNQPMSARTEQPLIVSLNAGLRFEIK